MKKSVLLIVVLLTLFSFGNMSSAQVLDQENILIILKVQPYVQFLVEKGQLDISVDVPLNTYQKVGYELLTNTAVAVHWESQGFSENNLLNPYIQYKLWNGVPFLNQAVLRPFRTFGPGESAYYTVDYNGRYPGQLRIAFLGWSELRKSIWWEMATDTYVDQIIITISKH